jgi:hypothetical protein
MSTQSQFDEVMRKIAQDYGKLNVKQQEFAIKEFGRIRAEITNLLADYAGSDGTIKRQRLTKLLRDLETIEANVRKNGMVTLQSIINDSSDFTTNAINGALTDIVGAAAISGVVMDRINVDVARYVISRFGEDGLVLSDRVWNVSGDIRDEMSKTLRAGIIRGEAVSALIKRIRAVHDNETWKIRRLVVTEGNTAYRAATAYNAQRSSVVKGVKINDRPGHNNHRKHRCYILAHEDKYGMGNGIYKPDDSEIYSPHPNCTSYITYVLNDKVSNMKTDQNKPNISKMVDEDEIIKHGGKVAKGNQVLSKLYGNQDDDQIEESLARTVSEKLRGQFRGAGSALFKLREEWVDDNKNVGAVAMENYISEKSGLSYKIKSKKKLTDREKAAVDIMQAETIRRFKEAGITHVKVYRGVAWDDKNSWLPKDTGNMTLTGRGLSSWTMRKDVAEEYASYVDDFAEMGNMAGIIEAIIPVSNYR